jgi:hypothetical protein
MRHARLGICLAVLVIVAAAPCLAQGGGSAIAKLRGYDEVPAVAVPNGGTFTATIAADNSSIDYDLTYNMIEGAPTQSHLHFAQKAVNGGIVVFLCSNLGNGPVGTQACPAGNGHITGTIHAADVLAQAGQSSNAGDLLSLIKEIKNGVVYVNVHSDQLPGGSIRGQLQYVAPAHSRPADNE